MQVFTGKNMVDSDHVKEGADEGQRGDAENEPALY